MNDKETLRVECQYRGIDFGARGDDEFRFRHLRVQQLFWYKESLWIKLNLAFKWNALCLGGLIDFGIETIGDREEVSRVEARKLKCVF